MIDSAMPRAIFFSLALFLSLAAQPSLNAAADGAWATAQLPLLTTVAALTVCGPAEAVLVATAAGLIMDVLSAPPLGVGVFCLTLLAFATRRATGGRLPATLPHLVLGAAALAFCFLLSSMTLRGLWTRTPIDGGPLLARAARGALGDATLAMVGAIVIKLLPKRGRTTTAR